MKLLLSSTDAAHLHLLKARLEAGGIPAFVSDENTAAAIPTGTLIEMGLWVHLDAHYDEALALLADPDHQVAQPLWPDQLALERAGGKALATTLVRLGLAVALTCLGLYLFAWLLYHR